jgi:hypothetical protein
MFWLSANSTSPIWPSISPPPSYAHWAEPVIINGQVHSYNVYLLYTEGGSGGLSYPSQTLMDDLFTTLGVLKEDFFKSRNGWELIKQVSAR